MKKVLDIPEIFKRVRIKQASSNQEYLIRSKIKSLFCHWRWNISKTLFFLISSCQGAHRKSIDGRMAKMKGDWVNHWFVSIILPTRRPDPACCFCSKWFACWFCKMWLELNPMHHLIKVLSDRGATIVAILLPCKLWLNKTFIWCGEAFLFLFCLT